MIDLKINQKVAEENAKHCRERGITLPTFAMMKNPELIPEKVCDQLKNIGLWDVNPLNLYRITWKNERKEKGGLYSDVNHVVLPPELTGCKAKIIALVGRYFPTGAHKVGATYGCLAPKLVTGQFSPGNDRAVWPSTGNYCRGGAYVSSLLGCNSIAILPEEMSKERFEWLQKVAGEVIATPGCESNVKEIFDKCWELRRERTDVSIFNQFEEFGNPLWHYNITGSAVDEILQSTLKPNERLAGYISSSGSAGTLAGGYYLKNKYPGAKVAAVEALQCPTLLQNGFGGHRIEGIGDKHVPWIHDAKNIDMNIAIDDEHTVRLLRLFNEKEGRDLLLEKGVDKSLVENLNLLGISGICNLVAAIKFAKYYELTEDDYVVTVFTDSLDLYGSRLKELEEEKGQYTKFDAHRDHEVLTGFSIDNMKELNYYDKKTVHNLKYFTWIEQQERELNELNDQWYDHENYWQKTFDQVNQIDELIMDFNEKIGL